MWGCIKRATCYVNQMGEFWCLFILTSLVGNFLNGGLLKQVLLYMKRYEATCSIQYRIKYAEDTY
jgi:hypothetical protein